ncbi:permease [Acinetobacter dispersus]|uniref:AEC family transporter n=1 Tax=Acinetobacter dispersus TaxID=70348 RepID=UPI00132F36F6|nr:permease [Acinetobacter dispersus]MCH7384675.1 permease [Acinetobacter dispersus]QHH99112.1 permease [Acinetobacter dispersus]
MTFILPISAFIFGLLLAQFKVAEQAKKILSSLLARLFIPVVIIYNMVFYQAGSFALMGFSFITSILLFYCFFHFSKDRLQALCMSYSNIGWLGFPFAIALFGEQVSSAMIALYIGGSLFGNIWAVSAVSETPTHYLSTLQKVLKSPPVLALFAALILWLFGMHRLQGNLVLEGLYDIAKFGMSFAGMCILGMWLRHTRVHFVDLWLSARTLMFKLLCGVVICTLTYYFFAIPQIESLLPVLFFLFCLPPAANIVALETHYQGTGVSARYIAAGTIVSCLVIVIYGLVLHIKNALI